VSIIIKDLATKTRAPLKLKQPAPNLTLGLNKHEMQNVYPSMLQNCYLTQLRTARASNITQLELK